MTHFINGPVGTDLTVHEAVERLDDQLREIANGERKASKLSLEDLAKLIVFVRFTLDSRTSVDDPKLCGDWFVVRSSKSYLVRRSNQNPRWRDAMFTEHLLGPSRREPKLFRTQDAAQKCADGLNAKT